jgi:hypothetical protein
VNRTAQGSTQAISAEYIGRQLKGTSEQAVISAKGGIHLDLMLFEK